MHDCPSPAQAFEAPEKPPVLAIVELAQRVDSNSAVSIVSAREEHGFAAEAAQKIAEELQLIEAVLRQMQRIS